MSSELLKKYAKIVESGNFFHNPDVPNDEQLTAPPDEVNINEGDDNYQINELLDQLEELLIEAVDVCRQLESSPIIGRTVGAYTRPCLQAWIDGQHQSGSVEYLRDSLRRSAEEDSMMDDEDDGSLAYAARMNR